MFKSRLSQFSFYFAALLMVVISTYAELLQTVSQQQTALGTRATALETQLEKLLPRFVVYYDTETIKAIANSVISPEVTQITLTDKITGEKGVWSADNNVAKTYWFDDIAAVTPLSLSATLTHNDSDIATLTLTISASQANAMVSQALQAFIVKMSVVVALMLVAFTLLLRRSNKAISRVTRTLDSLAEQDFTSTQATQRSGIRALDDALDNLAKHIQRMLQSLHKELNTLNNNMMYDAASGLPNGQYFRHQLNSWMGDNDEATGAVFIANMAWLETIYRRYGYVARDETWRLLATSLQTAFSDYPNACLARISEHEIALLLPETREDQSRNALHTLISTLNNEVTMAGFETNEGFHIGVVHGHGLPGTQLMSLADNALQRALKQNDVFVFNRGSEEQVIDRETWRTLINDALQNRNVRLLSQPVFYLSGNTSARLHDEIFTQANIEGTWQSGGRLMPYIQLFERGVEFDRVVVEQLIARNRVAPIEHPIALNLTEESLENRLFISWLQEQLKHALPADKICFEISEASARQNLTACITFSEAMRKAGAAIGIDHFGRYLQEVEYITALKPKYVKLDQAFSQDRNAQNRVFKEMLAHIADSQDIVVVATGIADDDSKAGINSELVDAYQGFIHPPTPMVQSEQTA